MFGLENRGKTLIFVLHHFDETIIIFILYFLRFGALKFLIGDYLVLRINKIIYYKQKIGYFIHLVFFPALFLQQICTGCRPNGVWIVLNIGISK